MYRREEAVSPVIGVILMVAITVILAAVIAAFVFGMAGNVQKTKNIALTAEANGTSPGIIDITNQGGKDIASVASFNVVIDGNAATGNPALTNTTGTYGVYQGKNPTAKSRVVVTAVFNDASQQVVIDTYV